MVVVPRASAADVVLAADVKAGLYTKLLVDVNAPFSVPRVILTF